MNLAYRYVAFMLMLAQLNLFSNKISIVMDRDFVGDDIREGSHVGPPQSTNFTGSIVTDKYFFGFGRGHLANFNKLSFMTAEKSAADIMRRNEELSKLNASMDTNEACRMATGWLTKLGIDVPTMETKYRLNVFRWQYFPDDAANPTIQLTRREPIMLPIFQVEWRGSPERAGRKLPEQAIVSLTISGVTKELLVYHMLDDSLASEPPIAIKDRDKLLAISDEEFQEYDAVQRSNVVVQFSQFWAGQPGGVSANEPPTSK